MTEANHGITFGYESFRCFYRDGLLIAVEKENGVIERFIVERSTNKLSNSIFGLDKVINGKPAEITLENH